MRKKWWILIIVILIILGFFIVRYFLEKNMCSDCGDNVSEDVKKQISRLLKNESVNSESKTNYDPES